MKKTKTYLKPCPFCGGDAEEKQYANPKNFYSIECVICHCGTDGFRINRVANSAAENIKANADVWNKRVNLTFNQVT